MSQLPRPSEAFLLFRAGDARCALPLDAVVETMRPLPVRRIDGTPSWVLGVTGIRGIPTPVVDAVTLVGASPENGAANKPAAARFVTVTVGDRQVALAVTEISGIRSIAAESLQVLPALLDGAQGETVAAVGTLDAELLLVLRGGHLVPPSLWTTLEAGEPAR